MQTLFAQLNDAARRKGITLRKAYMDAGLRDSTYYRHKHGNFIPSGRVFQRVMGHLERLPDARPGAAE